MLNYFYILEPFFYIAIWLWTEWTDVRLSIISMLPFTYPNIALEFHTLTPPDEINTPNQEDLLPHIFWKCSMGMRNLIKFKWSLNQRLQKIVAWLHVQLNHFCCSKQDLAVCVLTVLSTHSQKASNIGKNFRWIHVFLSL